MDIAGLGDAALSLVALAARPEFASVAGELESAVRAVLEELADGNDEPPAPPARKRKAKRTRSKPKRKVRSRSTRKRDKTSYASVGEQ